MKCESCNSNNAYRRSGSEEFHCKPCWDSEIWKGHWNPKSCCEVGRWSKFRNRKVEGGSIQAIKLLLIALDSETCCDDCARNLLYYFRKNLGLHGIFKGATCKL